MITFLYKIAFLLLFLPFLTRFKVNKTKLDHKALKVPFFDEISDLKSKNTYQRFSKLTSLKILIWGIWIALVFSIARPQHIGEKIPLDEESRVMVLALDASGSMKQTDFAIQGKRIQRFTAMKVIVGDFIKNREGDKIGIVLFGSHAYVYAPPSDDIKTLQYLLSTTEPAMVGGNTAMGDGLALAIETVKDLPQEQRVVILLSDGISNTGYFRDEEALKLAKEHKVKIYTIGIGSTSNDIAFFGLKIMGQSPIDEETLSKIATETGGKFYIAKNAQELFDIYNEIDKQEPIKSKGNFFRPIKELFYIPLAVAFILSVILFLFIIREDKKNG